MKTDAQIQQYVLTELNWDPSVTAAGIGIQVKDGIVTLTGHVVSHSEMLAAERAAQRVSGVKGMAMEIDVILPGSSHRNDVDTARSAQNVLQWTDSLPKDSVNAMVENGWITLSGEVDWEYQRQVASDAVRSLMGVTGVSNQIALRPQAISRNIKTDIEAALMRRVHSDSKDIRVSVECTGIILSGTVQSWSERELATQCAWSAPGVLAVSNHLSVI
jgi:osmotically-inducible protein OsmY